VHADGRGQTFDFRAHIVAISGYRQSDLKQISVATAGRLGGSTAPDGGRPMSTILVVDPDEVLAHSIARKIRSAGCEVIAVSSTTAALALLDSKRIDLILADIFMHKGQLSGLALARMARAKHRDIKLIFMTGSDDLQLYRQLVPGRLFHKPLDLKRLAAEIATQLAM
jgi:CheY-like chemotaxis protein